nr:MAG TPA: hypothetical protein [Caudoviricetes sp.]
MDNPMQFDQSVELIAKEMSWLHLPVLYSWKNQQWR